MAIKLSTDITTENLIGKSHWWGAPDLPSDIPYPCVTLHDDNGDYEEPLTFICQIRCSDLSDVDVDNILPHIGYLYFFAPIDYFLGEIDSQLDFHSKPVVIYSPSEEDLKPYILTWEGTDESIFRPSEMITFEFTTKETDDGHRMLGLPYQDDISNINPDYICLLQIDEDERWDLRFFDCGIYSFLIDSQDLKKRIFDNCIGELFYC